MTLALQISRFRPSLWRHNALRLHFEPEIHEIVEVSGV